jgi:hypothetical protein
VPSHRRMRVFDGDLIRGTHYGQGSCEPHLQAEHMAAPTNAAYVKKSPCQPGAVHTWHFSDMAQCLTWVRAPKRTLNAHRLKQFFDVFRNPMRRSLRKRPFLTRGLGLDAYWLPVPRQEFVEAAGGMTVGHALQDVSEPGAVEEDIRQKVSSTPPSPSQQAAPIPQPKPPQPRAQSSAVQSSSVPRPPPPAGPLVLSR